LFVVKKLINTTKDIWRFHVATTKAYEIGQLAGRLDVDSSGDITLTGGVLNGPATFYIDPAPVDSAGGLLVVRGDLQVDGTTTTVNSSTVTDSLTVQDDIIQSNSRFVSSSVTLTTTTETGILTFSPTAYAGAEVVIQMTQGSNRHITKLLITHDGSTPIATEFGVVYTSSELATFDLDVFGSAIRLKATPASSSSTIFKIVASLIDA
jgi:hypothetical protein